MSLPMLCQNTTAYRGPFVPTEGLRGQVVAHGLGDEDQLEVLGMNKNKTISLLGYISKDCPATIFDVNKYVMVRTIRVSCSGKPIDVWVH